MKLRKNKKAVEDTSVSTVTPPKRTQAKRAVADGAALEGSPNVELAEAGRNTSQLAHTAHTVAERDVSVTDDVVHVTLAPSALRGMNADERRHLIAEGAYYRALRRNFVDGSPERDWLEAEAELDARLAKTDH